MPVPPSSSAVGSRYSSYSSYSSYRNPSSSAYLGRTTSLDRSPYTGSGYASTYSSSYSSKYALPPRPTYSTSSDTYRSSRSLRQSPVRSSYSRLNSDSETAPSTSRYGSRYTRDSTRESSTSRDSGYGSRLTSRDRSVDLVNGNSLDTSHFGPSPSSYACNYRWEIRERDKNGDDDTSAQNGESEKVHISDRIRAFETRTPDSLVGLPAGRESSASSRDTIPSGSSRYLSARDSSSVRRRPYGASADTHSRSPSASKASPLAARKDTPETSSKKGSVEDRRPSVTELCRKYDSNHNVTNGLSRQDEDSDGSQSSGEAARQAYESSSTSAAPTTISSRRRTDSTSHGERTDSPTSTTLRVDSPNRSSRVESPARGRVESPITVHKESPARTRVDSPTRTQHESPSRKPIESYSDRDGRSSPLVNGILDKPKVRVEVDGYEGTRSRYRRDRVRERIAARLAKEVIRMIVMMMMMMMMM
ncbi:hypothetical protein Pmani_034160 [Petrolisthes manimaculis]|uniref:Uncharacterized protein n=1 Tax=Petrolisthes manimaculis TaxID=1843537 RepID=A0AAE1NN32_9EUCA|nr:hypothetical protein Pmani_034160 [Petrolisthes manimaculis]